MKTIVDAQLMSLDQLTWFAGVVLRGDLPEAVRFYQVHIGTSHIQWLVGHVAAAIDGLAMPALGAAPVLPSVRQEAFGFGSRPVPEPSAYPAWDVLVAELYESIEGLRSVLAGLTDADLRLPLPESSPFAKRFRARAEMVPFACLHSAYHLGQVSMLRRAQGLPSGMAM